MQTRRNESSLATIVAVGVLAALTGIAPVFAVDILDDPMQIDERASQLVQTSNSLCWEINRFHQQEPDYRETYQAAKELWSQAGQLREDLRAGPVETDVLKQKLTEMNALLTQVDSTLVKWGPGDRSLVATNAGSTPRTIVRPGVELDIPFVGVRLGGPQVVVTDDGLPQLERKRLHPNSRGSKRSLERELAAVKVSFGYLLEDADMPAPLNSSEAGAASEKGPIPQPLSPDTTSRKSQKAGPPSIGKPETVPARK